MINISLKAMLAAEVNNILYGFPSGRYYWKNGNDEYKQIVEIDLLDSRFRTIDGDFSEYDWEIKDSRIYIEG